MQLKYTRPAGVFFARELLGIIFLMQGYGGRAVRYIVREIIIRKYE